MPVLERDTHILAAPGTVWEIVTDPTRVSAWMPDVKERQPVTAQAGGIDARWREKGLLRGKPYETEYVVVEWEPARRLAYRQVSRREGDYFWLERICLDSEDGGTRVTVQLDYRLPPGLASKLYERFLFRKDFLLTMENRLDALKQLLEGD